MIENFLSRKFCPLPENNGECIRKDCPSFNQEYVYGNWIRLENQEGKPKAFVPKGIGYECKILELTYFDIITEDGIKEFVEEYFTIDKELEDMKQEENEAEAANHDNPRF